jgi:cytochrome o ubiquinol oxidase subunit I
VWHIWWLAIVGLVGMIGTFISRVYDTNVDYYVPGAEVEKIERARLVPLHKLIENVGPASAGEKVA